ncbi:hypothetical protein BV898_01110 [Hypsibius exemplaris]|uniref:Uncharacterized protein n=1 Tax=Hypsibius exemplaris TaxID=2072580 RepID=A0A1W0XD75_HYPEX|nr:hypothetical protein BV898_01110 [Hypsibius exemplaris]
MYPVAIPSTESTILEKEKLAAFAEEPENVISRVFVKLKGFSSNKVTTKVFFGISPSDVSSKLLHEANLTKELYADHYAQPPKGLATHFSSDQMMALLAAKSPYKIIYEEMPEVVAEDQQEIPKLFPDVAAAVTNVPRPKRARYVAKRLSK